MAENTETSDSGACEGESERFATGKEDAGDAAAPVNRKLKDDVPKRYEIDAGLQNCR